jgi:nitroreductase
LDFFELIKHRRSIRVFTNEEISDNEVNKILEAGILAPSAGNIQPWNFVVVREAEIKRGIVKASLNQTFIKEAPVVIVICANETKSKQGYGSRGVNLYCIQDTAAAAENMLLAVCALGLGACWVGAFNEEHVSAVLNIPKGIRPVIILPIGHILEKPCPTSKLSLKKIIHYETFKH